MFDMKKLALAGALAMIAAAATAAQPGHLADRHAARSVDCAACHKGHEQSVNMCSRCHLFEYKVP